MGKFISIAEYAALHNRAAITVQQKARRGGFKTAKKIGRDWFIDEDEPYEDNRHGSPDNVIRTRKCRQCGREFSGGPRAWYCPGCRMERKNRALERAGIDVVKRPLGSTDKCAICGKEYIVNGSRQRYCPDCASKAVKEVDRQQALKYYNDVKGTYNPARYKKRRVKTKICVICGKEFPCNGTARNTCSDECRKKQRQAWQRTADKNRKRNKPTGN